MAISLTLLLGEPPRPGTLLAEVSEELAAHGAEVTVRLPREQPLTLEHPRTTAGEPFVPDATLVDLARETGRVLGAHLLGVDVLDTRSGPVVVDVNASPGFRGVAGAPSMVADHLREHALRVAG